MSSQGHSWVCGLECALGIRCARRGWDASEKVGVSVWFVQVESHFCASFCELAGFSAFGAVHNKADWCDVYDGNVHGGRFFLDW